MATKSHQEKVAVALEGLSDTGKRIEKHLASALELGQLCSVKNSERWIR